MKAVLLIVLVVAAACGASSPPPPAPAPTPVSNTAPPPVAPADAAPDPGSASDAIAAMKRFKDELCKCTDTPCAQRVSDEMTRWATDMAKSQAQPPKLSDDDLKTATALGEAMGTCMQRAMGGGAPPAP
jgi:hypothetical protein